MYTSYVSGVDANGSRGFKATFDLQPRDGDVIACDELSLARYGIQTLH